MDKLQENNTVKKQSPFSLSGMIVVCLFSSIFLFSGKEHLVASLGIMLFCGICFGFINADKADVLIKEYYEWYHPGKQVKKYHWFDYLAFAALLVAMTYYSFFTDDTSSDWLAYGAIIMFAALANLAYLLYVYMKMRRR